MTLSQYGFASTVQFYNNMNIVASVQWTHYVIYKCQLRNSKEVTTEEYNDFYKSTFNQYLDPLASSHFTTEVKQYFKYEYFFGVVFL